MFRSPKSQAPRRAARPQVEALEDRLTPTLVGSLPTLAPALGAALSPPPAAVASPLLTIPPLPIDNTDGVISAQGGRVVGHVHYTSPGNFLVTDQSGSVAGRVWNSGHGFFYVADRYGVVVGRVTADGPQDALVTDRYGFVVGHARARAGTDSFLITNGDGYVFGATRYTNRIEAGGAGLLLLLR